MVDQSAPMRMSDLEKFDRNMGTYNHICYPTTRRHPRTLLEAWPHRHPYCIECPPPRIRWWRIVLATFIGAAVGTLAAIWWSGI
jgi:hypothetical protein